MANEPKQLEPGDWHIPFSDDIAVSTGKCARVSYLTHDGKRDETKDIALHDQLLNAEPPHASPFEHCACAETDNKFYANFKGFKSYRNFLGIWHYTARLFFVSELKTIRWFFYTLDKQHKFIYSCIHKLKYRIDAVLSERFIEKIDS